MDIFDFIEVPFVDLTLSSKIAEDDITHEIERIFDYDGTEGCVSEVIQIPKFPNDYQIGLIVGGSGSGKSTILRESFGKEENVVWNAEKSIASHFASFDEASGKFGAVGLNSIPTWLKPYPVLSNGERFRADLARRLKDGAVIDEFTSVVNREVAISCSISISKFIRRTGMKNVTFASCHDDIINYLQPDWVYNTDTHEFYNGRYLCRPKIDIKVAPCDRKAWDLFKRHHYLSGKLNTASVCYMATYHDVPVAFIALLAQPGRDVKHAWREHRVVVLPDYQGMGIGNKFSEMLGQAYIEKGCRYFCKTSNPRMGEHRDRSSLWRATVHNKGNRPSYFKKDGTVRTSNRYGMSAELVARHALRICYTHEFIGDGKTYPYTYKTLGKSQKKRSRQMNLFDYLQVDSEP